TARASRGRSRTVAGCTTSSSGPQPWAGTFPCRIGRPEAPSSSGVSRSQHERSFMKLEEVHVAALAPDRLLPLIGAERAERFEETAKAARELLAGRVVLNVNSTASGGGVAEMLRTLLAYARGAGVDAQWVVIQGDPHFFEITKRVHNN